MSTGKNRFSKAYPLRKVIHPTQQVLAPDHQFPQHQDIIRSSGSPLRELCTQFYDSLFRGIVRTECATVLRQK